MKILENEHVWEQSTKYTVTLKKLKATTKVGIFYSVVTTAEEEKATGVEFFEDCISNDLVSLNVGLQYLLENYTFWPFGEQFCVRKCF